MQHKQSQKFESICYRALGYVNQNGWHYATRKRKYNPNGSAASHIHMQPAPRGRGRWDHGPVPLVTAMGQGHKPCPWAMGQSHDARPCMGHGYGSPVPRTTSTIDPTCRSRSAFPGVVRGWYLAARCNCHYEFPIVFQVFASVPWFSVRINSDLIEELLFDPFIQV